jgi:hypothetical protein
MTLVMTGRELQIILGLKTALSGVPFAKAPKPSPSQLETLRDLAHRTLCARDKLLSHEEEWRSPELGARQRAWARMLSSSGDLDISTQEALVVTVAIRVCLVEFSSDYSVAAHLGSGLAREDLEAMRQRLSGNLKDPP